MKVRLDHPWDLTPQAAARLQLELRERIKMKRDFGRIRTVAGADIALDKAMNMGYAGVIVYSFPDGVELERQSAARPLTFPYVPGLLVFREGPVLLAALEKLRTDPDLIFLDAHGYSHPRRFGLASHMGVILNRPAIGCAKSVLVGCYDDPANDAGTWTPLMDGNEIIGAVLRTRRNTRPVFISVGHRIDLETAVEFATACTDGFRIPRPTRKADHFVGELKRQSLRGVC
jgi:deoxyribonuclease V